MLKRRFWATALVLVAGVSFLGTRGLGELGGSKRSFAADAEDERAGIAKQEVELAKQALQIFTSLEKQGRVEMGSDGVVVIWSKRLVEATRKSGAAKAEIVQAIEDHLARMEAQVEIAKVRQQSARGTAIDVLSARYDVLEARGWLAEERGK